MDKVRRRRRIIGEDTAQGRTQYSSSGSSGTYCRNRTYRSLHYFVVFRSSDEEGSDIEPRVPYRKKAHTMMRVTFANEPEIFEYQVDNLKVG
eukprot:6490783-Amphidinium_carterae.3